MAGSKAAGVESQGDASLVDYILGERPDALTMRYAGGNRSCEVFPLTALPGDVSRPGGGRRPGRLVTFLLLVLIDPRALLRRHLGATLGLAFGHPLVLTFLGTQSIELGMEPLLLFVLVGGPTNQRQ